MAKVVRYSYDPESDELNITLGESKRAIHAELGDEVYVRLDPKTKGVLGLTILQPCLFSVNSRCPTASKPSCFAPHSDPFPRCVVMGSSIASRGQSKLTARSCPSPGPPYHLGGPHSKTSFLKRENRLGTVEKFVIQSRPN